MNNFKTALPALTSIANAASEKVIALNKVKLEAYDEQEINSKKGYINPEIFSYYDCELSLVDMIDSISETEYNTEMAEEMAKAIEILQSVKTKINQKEDSAKLKLNNISKQIATVYKKARLDFSTVIDFDNLLFVRIPVKKFDESHREKLIDVMSENGIYSLCNDVGLERMTFAGVVENQENIPKLSHFIFNMLDGKVTTDRNLIGSITVKPMPEADLVSFLSQK